MLKLRILTAAILIPLVVLALLYLPTFIITLSAGVVFLVAALEWANLMPTSSRISKPIMLILTTILGFLSWYCDYSVANHYMQTPVLCATLFIIVAMVWWLVAIPLLAIYPRLQNFWQNKIVGFGVGVVVLVAAWWAITIIHRQEYGNKLILFVCVVVWAADIGAYFAGKAFGKHKLAPQVSPGKTWEGVVGAFLAVGIFSFLYVTLVLPTLTQHHKQLIFMALLLTPITIAGDLQESVFKRLKGVKDSGTLFPGHGGLLDRIDSLIAALPFAAFMLTVSVTNTANLEFPFLFNWLRSLCSTLR